MAAIEPIDNPDTVSVASANFRRFIVILSLPKLSVTRVTWHKMSEKFPERDLNKSGLNCGRPPSEAQATLQQSSIGVALGRTTSVPYSLRSCDYSLQIPNL
jgi:hypothetical protein